MNRSFPFSTQAKLIKLYYGVEISASFAKCADDKWAEAFKKASSLNTIDKIFLNWNPDEEFDYEKGDISYLNTQIFLKFGPIRCKLAWKSVSGHIYDITDENINCNDLEFWFEGINPTECYKKTYPKWSLFTFPDSTVEHFNKKNEIQLSAEFIVCADKQLSPIFEKTTGLKINKHISINIGSDDNFAYSPAVISSLAVVLYVNHNWNYNITMLWKSKSGRIYKPDDTDIDCNDIEFSLEGLDPALYHKQMFPKAEFPFKLKNLSYQLVVNRLNMDCTIEMKLKEEEIPNYKDITDKVDNFINQFNAKSTKKKREDGVVHNWRHSIENNKLIYEIDSGFAGPSLMKKLLPFLSSLNCFETIEIN